MRTMIRGGWIVGFQHEHHTILRDGVLVFEDDRILYVGPQFAGEVDTLIEADGKLVAPGFVNLHALANLDMHALVMSEDAHECSLASSAIDAENPAMQDDELRSCIRFSLLQLLRSGSTTIVGTTNLASPLCAAPHREVPLLVEAAAELGARLYVSHQFQAGGRLYTPGAGWGYHWDGKAARAELAYAEAIVRQFEGVQGGRIRTILSPHRLASCPPDLLRAVKAAARDLAVPVRLSVAESLIEFHECRAMYGWTPVQLLHDIGFLDEGTMLTHLLYTTMHPASGFPVDDTGDLRLVAATGATVVHCPVAALRRGCVLGSFDRYRTLGVNVGLGTSAFPQDMIEEMRWAALGCKWVDRDANCGTARAVFHAATLAGAQALGRRDIGRLAPGAKADIIIVDLHRLHHGPVDDPIKTLVYASSGCDIETVIVDGHVVMADGAAPDLDESSLRRAVTAAIHRRQPHTVSGKPPTARLPVNYAVAGGAQ